MWCSTMKQPKQRICLYQSNGKRAAEEKYLVVLAPVHVGATSNSSAVHDVGGLHTLNVGQDGLAVLQAGGTILILSSL